MVRRQSSDKMYSVDSFVEIAARIHRAIDLIPTFDSNHILQTDYLSAGRLKWMLSKNRNKSHTHETKNEKFKFKVTK